MHKTLIDIRLAQKDPAELGGVYFPATGRFILSHSWLASSLAT
jgi:hypothetical protein